MGLRTERKFSEALLSMFQVGSDVGPSSKPQLVTTLALHLRRAEQVVEEGHVELEDLDELDDAAVGDIELAVEVKRPRVAVAAARHRHGRRLSLPLALRKARMAAAPPFLRGPRALSR